MPNNDTLRSGTMYDQDHHVITVDKMLSLSGMKEGDTVRVAHDPSVDARGDVESYIESSMYIYQSYHWQRMGQPETIDRANEFHVRDGDTYHLYQPTSDDGSSNTQDVLYSYIGSRVASASTTATGSAASVFQNNPNGASQAGSGWGTGWSSHDVNSATPARLLLDLGEEIKITGMEWQGEGDTGYGPSSGPNATRLRFGTQPLLSAYANTTNVTTTINKNWLDLDWGNNTSSPNGLAEFFDLRAANGGNAITARYFAVDCDTSHDTRNMTVRHILLHHETPAGDSAIYVTIDDTVKTFTIKDGNGNFNVASNAFVELGTDNISLERTGEFRFYRVGNGFKVYEGQ